MNDATTPVISAGLYTPEERARRDATIWTPVQGFLAAFQFIVFGVSVCLITRYMVTGAGESWAVGSVVFKTLVLYTIMITGSIWGRPTWGTWWEWDGRMTSMLVLLFLYFAYMALANASDERTTVSRATAIFGIVGAVNIPIINRSVVWWNSLHQGPSITLRGSSISSEILWPLLPTVIGFSLLFGGIVLMRMRANLADAKVEARMRHMAAS